MKAGEVLSAQLTLDLNGTLRAAGVRIFPDAPPTDFMREQTAEGGNRRHHIRLQDAHAVAVFDREASACADSIGAIRRATPSAGKPAPPGSQQHRSGRSPGPGVSHLDAMGRCLRVAGKDPGTVPDIEDAAA